MHFEALFFLPFLRAALANETAKIVRQQRYDVKAATRQNAILPVLIFFLSFS